VNEASPLAAGTQAPDFALPSTPEQRSSRNTKRLGSRLRFVFRNFPREDFLSGIRRGVNGTPTFFINGIRHDNAWDVDTLEQALRADAR
jgi:hypothetical protein